MFKEMRRKEKAMSKEETDKVLKNALYGVLAMYGTEEYPYAIPISYVYEKDAIYIHCAAGVGSKLEAIAANNKVCFTVTDNVETLASKFSTKFTSVVIFGHINKAVEEETAMGFVNLIHKYSPDFIKEGKEYIAKASSKAEIYKITIDHITGKARNN